MTTNAVVREQGIRRLRVVLVAVLVLQAVASYLVTETRGLLTTSYLVEGKIVYATEITTGSEDNDVFLLGGIVCLFLATWFVIRWRSKLGILDAAIAVSFECFLLFLILNLIEVGSIADTIRIDNNGPLIAWLVLQVAVLLIFVGLAVIQVINRMDTHS